MEDLDTRSLVLDISTNLSRVGRFAMDKNMKRVKQFLLEIDEYLSELNKRKVPRRFEKTLDNFKKVFNNLKRAKKLDRYFADDVFTYSNILAHRAGLL